MQPVNGCPLMLNSFHKAFCWRLALLAARSKSFLSSPIGLVALFAKAIAKKTRPQSSLCGRVEGPVKIDIFIFETVKRNTAQRPFWAARRVARKFPACGRELRRGGSADPEHLNAEGWSRPSGGEPKTKDICFQQMSFVLARLRGFEPPTYRLGGGRSILLSYRRV